MVENSLAHYGEFRKDKEADPGYSRELLSTDLDPMYYDRMDEQPQIKEHLTTYLEHFEKHVKNRGDEPFLGSRKPLAGDKGGFGPYEWQTYNEVSEIAQNVARAIKKLNLMSLVEAEGREWRFMGVWSKNRWEWLATHLADMHYNVTTVGFFDAMGSASVEYILKQTELSTFFVSGEYVKRVLEMKKSGLAACIKNLVSFDGVDAAQHTLAQELGVTLYDFAQIQKLGAEAVDSVGSFEKPTKDDYVVFSYTSGTTGDSKGVKLTHKNILSSGASVIQVLQQVPNEVMMSYLPYPHSFEQVLLGYAFITGAKIGYYQGDPQKLVEDCQLLQPTIFPSVPRLFNRIYGKLKARFDSVTGCKKWLVNKGLDSKLAAMSLSAATTSGCYDALVFRKVAAMLGGKVRLMISGSAPIDKAVIEFLRVCFCCPVVEGYGLTEVSGGAAVAHLNDNFSGHVGGPLSCIKFRVRDVPEMEYLTTDKPYPRGELCMKGVSVFDGYFRREDKTKEAFDEQGWFLTGDVVQVHPNGSFKIIDRSKNIFKLSQGEYIAPEKLENIFVLSPFVAQMMVYGDSFKNCCVGILVPDVDHLKLWGKNNGMEGKGEAEIVAHPDFKKAVLEDMTKLAKENKLTSLEKPKDVFLTLDAFSIDNEMLTPTFKLKRNVGKERYQAQIDEMYAKIAAAEHARENRS